MPKQTNTEATASKTPWRFAEGSHNKKDSGNLGAIISSQGWYVAEICPDAGDDDGDAESLANAALICKAVNLFEAHEAVAEAAKPFVGAQDSPAKVILARALSALTALKERGV